MDIDVREFSTNLKFDRGQEEISTETIDIGTTSDQKIIRVVVSRADNMNVVSIKVQYV